MRKWYSEKHLKASSSVMFSLTAHAKIIIDCCLLKAVWEINLNNTIDSSQILMYLVSIFNVHSFYHKRKAY